MLPFTSGLFVYIVVASVHQSTQQLHLKETGVYGTSHPIFTGFGTRLDYITNKELDYTYSTTSPDFLQIAEEDWIHKM